MQVTTTKHFEAISQDTVMEWFFLNLKFKRVWQRRYANHDEAQRDTNSTSSVSTTPCACIPLCAICRPLPTKRNRREKTYQPV